MVRVKLAYELGALRVAHGGEFAGVSELSHGADRRRPQYD
jgi:hypothetical protein